MLTLKIITTDPTLLKWRSLNNKINAIKGVLNTAKNAQFFISVEYRDVVPEVVNGFITHAFMDNLRKGLHDDFVVLHMSNEQRKTFKIKPSLRGARQRDNDTVGEMYLWADENTTRGPKYNQFIETTLHELRHEIMAGLGLPDNTHELHGKDGTLVNEFHYLDMAKYRPKRQAKNSLLRRTLVELIGRLRAPKPTTLHKRFHQNYRISQDYGVINPVYKLTGRHIGIDWATPIGTPILAPWDGEMTVVGTHGSLGHFGYYEYEYAGRKRVERILHLQEVPVAGKYKRGAEIAYSGNTGFSTGPHTHIDGWWDEINTGLINSKNWDKLTYNPNIT